MYVKLRNQYTELQPIYQPINNIKHYQLGQPIFAFGYDLFINQFLFSDMTKEKNRRACFYKGYSLFALLNACYLQVSE
jgi:hypothetical protein